MVEKCEMESFFGENNAANCASPLAEVDINPFFIRLMAEWRESQGSIAIYIMRKYKRCRSPELRALALKYASLLLLNPELARQKDKIVLAGPAVVVPHFEEIGDVLEDLADTPDFEKIYAPILYKLGVKAAGEATSGISLCCGRSRASRTSTRFFAGSMRGGSRQTSTTATEASTTTARRAPRCAPR